MRRRHRSAGRMMLRGKPGLIIVVVLVVVGTLVAYYTWSGSSSSTATKTRFSKYGSKNKYGQRNSGVRFMDQKQGQGLQLANPPQGVVRNQLRPAGMKPLEPPNQFDSLQDGPKPDKDDDYRFEDDEKQKEELEGVDNRDNSDPREPESKEEKFKESDESKTIPKVLYPQLYVAPDPDMSEQFRKMEHIVHLDLKGAPPKVDYLISLMPMLKKLGATGFLIEYEDMFPYNGELLILAADNAYKLTDVERLLNAAKLNELRVIPLVQTFGHMEYVLKYPKYLELRESPDTPQVITPTSLKSYELIQKMISQVMKLHTDAPYIHIGCDEVYGLGRGKVMDMIIKENITKQQVFLNHVKQVAKYVKTSFPKTGVIMWDDELRKQVSSELIAKSELGKFVEPMVWSYVPHPSDRFPDGMWAKYAKHFSGIWAASSFKGATGSAQFYTNVSYHLENHVNWVREIKQIKNLVPAEKFRGFALTGWSRYDHFAALCELLPSAIPSLAVSLQVVQNGGFSPAIHRTVTKMLNCTQPVELDFPRMINGTYVISQDCNYPGSSFYYAVQQLWAANEKFAGDAGLQSRIEGWLTDFHIRTGFSSPGHMKILQHKLFKIMDSLQTLVEPIRFQLKKFYDNLTVEEWIAVHLTQKMDFLKDKMSKTKILLKPKTWEKRPTAQQQVAGGLPQQQQWQGGIQKQFGQQQQVGQQRPFGQQQGLGQQPQPFGQQRVGGQQQFGQQSLTGQQQFGQKSLDGQQFGQKQNQLGRQVPQFGQLNQNQLGRQVPQFGQLNQNQLQRQVPQFGQLNQNQLGRQVPQFGQRPQFGQLPAQGINRPLVGGQVQGQGIQTQAPPLKQNSLLNPNNQANKWQELSANLQKNFGKLNETYRNLRQQMKPAGFFNQNQNGNMAPPQGPKQFLGGQQQQQQALGVDSKNLNPNSKFDLGQNKSQGEGRLFGKQDGRLPPAGSEVVKNPFLALKKDDIKPSSPEKEFENENTKLEEKDNEALKDLSKDNIEIENAENENDDNNKNDNINIENDQLDGEKDKSGETKTEIESQGLMRRRGSFVNLKNEEEPRNRDIF